MNKCLQLAQHHQLKFRHLEQDVMNLIFLRERWDLLPFKFNAQGLGTYALDKIQGPGGNMKAKMTMLYSKV